MFDLYENPRALKAGYMVSDSAVDYAMAGTNPMEVQNRLLRGIAGKRLYNLKTVSSETTLTGMAAFNVRLKKDEHGYLYIPGTEPDTVTINGQEQKLDYWNNNFLDLGTYDTETIVHITANSGIHEAVLGTYQEADLDEIYEKLSLQQTDLAGGKGNITVQRDGILMIGSFFDPDMQIYVDGKKAETLNLQGLTGVKLSAGPHKIVMKYHTPGFWIGAVLSILMVFVLGIIEYARSRKRKNYGRRRYFTWIQ